MDLWFAQFEDTDLSNLGNWFEDAGFTIPASALPGPEDSVNINDSVQTGTLIALSVENNGLISGGTITCTSFVNFGSVTGGSITAETINNQTEFIGGEHTCDLLINVGSILLGIYHVGSIFMEVAAAIISFSGNPAHTVINGPVDATTGGFMYGATYNGTVMFIEALDGTGVTAGIFNDTVTALGTNYGIYGEHTFNSDLILPVPYFSYPEGNYDGLEFIGTIPGRLSIDGGQTFSLAPADYTVDPVTFEITINNYPAYPPPGSGPCRKTWSPVWSPTWSPTFPPAG